MKHRLTPYLRKLTKDYPLHIFHFDSPAQSNISVVYLPGFKSHFVSRKLVSLLEVCQEIQLPLFSLEYRGHSDNTVEKYVLSNWIEDAQRLMQCCEAKDPSTPSQILLIGASMGAWIAFVIALQQKALPSVVSGIITIGGGFNGFQAWWREYDEALKDAKQTGRPSKLLSMDQSIYYRPSQYGDGPYPVTRALLEDSEQYYLSMGESQNQLESLQNIPIHLIHGQLDPDVPWNRSKKVYEAIKGNSSKAKFTLVPNGDHRLSSDADLMTIQQAVKAMVADINNESN